VLGQVHNTASSCGRGVKYRSHACMMCDAVLYPHSFKPLVPSMYACSSAESSYWLNEPITASCSASTPSCAWPLSPAFASVVPLTWPLGCQRISACVLRGVLL